MKPIKRDSRLAYRANAVERRLIELVALQELKSICEFVRDAATEKARQVLKDEKRDEICV